MIIAPNGSALKAPQLIRTVLEPIHKWACKLVPEGELPEYIIDGASIHTAHITQAWMEQHNFIKRPHPAESPDLNRIECMWRVVADKLDGRHPTTDAGFRRVAQHAWKDIPDHTVARFIDELPEVMHRVHEKPHKHCNL